MILDLSIGDALNGEWHWFEVVVRGVLTLWPDAVVITVVSAIPVIVRSGSEEWLAIARHPRVARFPSTSELMGALRRGGSLWIENAGTADGPARVKILGVVSADCH